MQILFGEIVLTDGQQLAADAGERLEATQVVETQPAWESADAEFLARANRTRRLPLSVPHKFPTVLAAEEFTLDHYESLVGADTLTFVCGRSAENSRRYARAALAGFSISRPAPLLVVVDYSFVLGPISKFPPSSA